MKIFVLLCLLTFTALFSGCVVRQPNMQNPNVDSTTVLPATEPDTAHSEPKEEPNNFQDNELEDQTSASETVNVNLYFSDSQAMGLIIEQRSVDDDTPQRLIEELIKGPLLAENVPTIPLGTRLIGIEITGGTAFVNFSEEFILNHGGGSAGESLTLGSIVNTLVLHEGSEIQKVQILVDGSIVETLAGHIDISIPLESSN